MPASDPHTFADPDQGTIEHIDLKLQLDFAAQVVHAQVTYRLDRPLTSSFTLDSRDLQIYRVRIGQRELAWELGEPDPIRGESLTLSGLQDADSFTIECTTAPQARALQWLSPAQTAGGRHPFLYSQCQSIHARTIFPCQDTPAVRFTYEAEVEVPDPLTAVMAAEKVADHRRGDRGVYHFKMPQPIPSYLFAIAVGELAFQEVGPRTGVYAEPDVLSAAAWEFGENESKLEGAEALFGPYLWDRYDVLVLPPSFPFGGMENPRLTFLTPAVLQGDRSETSLVTHELAHAWTGNLVTNCSWEHFWINEGWTTYAQRRIDEVIYGSDLVQLMRANGTEVMLDDIKSLGGDSKLTCLKAALSDVHPDRAFSSIPYIKGCHLLWQLEQAVGRQAFDAFIAKYIETYAFRSLSSEDFIEFLEVELPRARERVDVDRWIYAPGFPEGAERIQSKMRDEVMAAIDAYEAGELPDEARVADWHYLQTRVFLLKLPERISAADCGYLDKLFDMTNMRHASVLFTFYELAIRSGYEPVLPRLERFVGSIGSAYNLAKIFRAMAEEQWSRPRARPLFERWRNFYHPITVTALEQVLEEAGL